MCKNFISLRAQRRPSLPPPRANLRSERSRQRWRGDSNLEPPGPALSPGRRQPSFSFPLPTPSQLSALVEQLYWRVPRPRRASAGSPAGTPAAERPTALRRRGRCWAAAPVLADEGASGLSRLALCVTGRGVVKRVRQRRTREKNSVVARTICSGIQLRCSSSGWSRADAAGGRRNARGAWEPSRLARPHRQQDSLAAGSLVSSLSLPLSPSSLPLFPSPSPCCSVSLSLSCVPSPRADK